MALGAVFFTVMALSRSDWFQAAGQLMLSGALIGLLTGRPGGRASPSSLTAVGLLFCLEGVGLYALVTGSNPMARIALRARGEIEADPIREVKGERSPWRLRAPDGKWHLRTSEAAARDNPLVDKWLIAPAHDAHVIVIPELAEGIDADALAKVVLDNARAASSAFRVVDEPKPLTSAIGPARLAHSASTINGIRLGELLRGVRRQDRHLSSDRVRSRRSLCRRLGQLLGIIHSFAL